MSYINTKITLMDNNTNPKVKNEIFNRYPNGSIRFAFVKESAVKSTVKLWSRFEDVYHSAQSTNVMPIVKEDTRPMLPYFIQEVIRFILNPGK